MKPLHHDQMLVLRLGNDAVTHAAQRILQIEQGTDKNNCKPFLDDRLSGP
jgi:hypothetical protein